MSGMKENFESMVKITIRYCIFLEALYCKSLHFADASIRLMLRSRQHHISFYLFRLKF